jgi:hypothetical protein
VLYQTEFKVKSDPELVYELTSGYFASLGYRLIGSVRPSTLSFTKGSHFGWTFKGTTRNLAIALMSTNGEVEVHCTFELPRYWAIGQGKAKAELELEVKQALLMIQEHILNSSQNPSQLKEGKPVKEREEEEHQTPRESELLHDLPKKEGMDLTTIAELARWTESSIRRVGKERVKAIVDIYQMMGYLPLNLKELLLQLIRLAEEEGLQEQVKMRDFLPILIQLDTLLGQNLKTESAVLSLLFEGEENFSWKRP